ncbi:hypothetical protein HB364_21110 [Pseudoflavitalea sp. X16]|uniref:hypothetical protein n=1 Tax=Paraflavitalea devenefica TaxID=2716334 RepID=UPI0014220F08|nr:hypothetical protein [Paraflavitalea devenefica]NII27596.1 hypothetical protein [Paraflavitalea devenefica]
MKKKRRSVNSYTEVELIQIAAKHKTKSDFFENERNAHRAAKILGCFDRCVAHMEEKQKPKGYWTKKLCRVEALKHRNRFDFFKNGSAAYQAAQDKGWLDEVCTHMVSKRKTKGFWREGINLILEAMKYESRIEFCKGSPGAYTAAQSMGVMDDICVHMRRIGNAQNKLVYAYEFSDKYVYVGLTFDMKNREKHRISSQTDAVTMYRNKSGLIPTLIIKTDFLPVREAAEKENEWVKQYSINGWTILNRMKPGAVGGNIILWTKGNCLKAAKTCASRKEFYSKHASAYGAALKNGWLDDCCSHFKGKRKPYKHWTEENILMVARDCKSRVDFENNYGSAYNAAMQKGILQMVCAHMAYLKKPNNFWNYERIIEFARNCESKNEFIKRYKDAYQAARNKKLHYQLYSDMEW